MLWLNRVALLHDVSCQRILSLYLCAISSQDIGYHGFSRFSKGLAKQIITKFTWFTEEYVLENSVSSLSTFCSRLSFSSYRREQNIYCPVKSSKAWMTQLNGYEKILTFSSFKHFARYFFISWSLPGKKFKDRWMRCLNGFVSTTSSTPLPWMAEPDNENCSKNLGKVQNIFFLKVSIITFNTKYIIQIFGYLVFSCWSGIYQGI